MLKFWTEKIQKPC